MGKRLTGACTEDPDLVLSVTDVTEGSVCVGQFLLTMRGKRIGEAPLKPPPCRDSGVGGVNNIFSLSSA